MNISIKEETSAQRIRLGMTQEELAERLYMKKSTISYYETDKKEMRASCIAEIPDQLKKDDFVRKYIRKDIKCKLTSFRMMFIL